MFNLKKQPKSFKEKASDILGIFNKTLTELAELNLQIESRNTAIQETLNTLSSELDENQKLLKKNETTIENIEKIVS